MGGQSHVINETRVPSADDVPPAVGIRFELIYQLDHLVGVRSIGIRP